MVKASLRTYLKPSGAPRHVRERTDSLPRLLVRQKEMTLGESASAYVLPTKSHIEPLGEEAAQGKGWREEGEEGREGGREGW